LRQASSDRGRDARAFISIFERFSGGVDKINAEFQYQEETLSGSNPAVPQTRAARRPPEVAVSALPPGDTERRPGIIAANKLTSRTGFFAAASSAARAASNTLDIRRPIDTGESGWAALSIQFPARVSDADPLHVHAHPGGSIGAVSRQWRGSRRLPRLSTLMPCRGLSGASTRQHAGRRGSAPS
jgi:hypothetical protein